jgi:hypothetical protein
MPSLPQRHLAHIVGAADAFRSSPVSFGTKGAKHLAVMSIGRTDIHFTFIGTTIYTPNFTKCQSIQKLNLIHKRDLPRQHRMIKKIMLIAIVPISLYKKKDPIKSNDLILLRPRCRLS